MSAGVRLNYLWRAPSSSKSIREVNRYSHVQGDTINRVAVFIRTISSILWRLQRLEEWIDGQTITKNSMCKGERMNFCSILCLCVSTASVDPLSIMPCVSTCVLLNWLITTSKIYLLRVCPPLVVFVFVFVFVFVLVFVLVRGVFFCYKENLSRQRPRQRPPGEDTHAADLLYVMLPSSPSPYPFTLPTFCLWFLSSLPLSHGLLVRVWK